jgi:hypothetical protein
VSVICRSCGHNSAAPTPARNSVRFLIAQSLAEVGAIIGVTVTEFREWSEFIASNGELQSVPSKWIHNYFVVRHKRPTADGILKELSAYQEHKCMAIVFRYSYGLANATQRQKLRHLVAGLGFDPDVLFSEECGSDVEGSMEWRTVLGVGPNAELKEIEVAYRRLASRFHPDAWQDATPSERERASQKMKELNAAYSASKKAHAASSHGQQDSRRRDQEWNEQQSKAEAKRQQEKERAAREAEKRTREEAAEREREARKGEQRERQEKEQRERTAREAELQRQQKERQQRPPDRPRTECPRPQSPMMDDKHSRLAVTERLTVWIALAFVGVGFVVYWASLPGPKNLSSGNSASQQANNKRTSPDAANESDQEHTELPSGQNDREGDVPVRAKGNGSREEKLKVPQGEDSESTKQPATFAYPAEYRDFLGSWETTRGDKLEYFFDPGGALAVVKAGKVNPRLWRINGEKLEVWFLDMSVMQWAASVSKNRYGELVLLSDKGKAATLRRTAQYKRLPHSVATVLEVDEKGWITLVKEPAASLPIGATLSVFHIARDGLGEGKKVGELKITWTGTTRAIASAISQESKVNVGDEVSNFDN